VFVAQAAAPADELVVGLAGTLFAMARGAFFRINRFTLFRSPVAWRQPGAVRADADVPGRDLVRGGD